MRHLFKLEPDYRERVWGGPRLSAAARPSGEAGNPIGEAWLAFEGSRVAGGSDGDGGGAGLSDLLRAEGERLLGPLACARSQNRLPLMAKILDTSEWLSVQVHPDDEQARRMVGPEEFGKTEAWYVLDAAPGPRILAGVKPGTTREALVEAIRSGAVLDVAADVRIETHDSVLIPAGMLHALGPGLLVYEIQQHSDTTYRAYDWGRPATAGRKLHIDESIEVVEPYEARVVRIEAGAGNSPIVPVVASAFFRVASIDLASGEPVRADTGRSFEYLTAVDGTAEIAAGEESVTLAPFETAFVAADTGPYELRSQTRAVILRSGLPEGA